MRKTTEHGGSAIRAERMRYARRRVSCVALPFLWAGVASVGLAAPAGSETSAIRVRYSRTELTSTAGARNLLRRIGNAALESCGASPFSLTEFKAATEQSRCWRAAVDNALRNIGSPVLDAAAEQGR